jgi:hypothetical protein
MLSNSGVHGNKSTLSSILRKVATGCPAILPGVQRLQRQTIRFDEILEQVRELLQSKGRVAYRALKRRFDLDDEYLEDLKSELIKAERVAVDEDSEVLVWTGAEIEGEKAKGEKAKRKETPNPEL